MLYDDPALWDLGQPILCESFDEAVEMAKQKFASMDQVDAHLLQQSTLYKQKLDKANLRIAKRDKTWES